MSLSCGVPGRGTQQDPILERIRVENPIISGASGQLWRWGYRAAWVTALQAGREMLAVPSPTAPSIFSAETHFPNPSWPVLLLKAVIYHTDNVALQPLVRPSPAVCPAGGWTGGDAA